MANVLDQAQNVRGVVAAARMRDRWARKEANATEEGQRRMYREAIFDVEERFPELGDVPVGGAEAFARERGGGTGSRSPVHEGRRRSGAGKAPARTAAKSTAKSSSTPPAAKGSPRSIPGLTPGARRTGRSSGQPTPRLDRAISQTGIPSALSSSGSTTMAALGAIVGLSLLFLVLSSAERPGSGAAALPTVIASVTRWLHRFLSLEDVFPGPRQIPAGMVEGRGGKLVPEGPPGSYNRRVQRGEAAGPPTPPALLRRYRHEHQQIKAGSR